MSHILDQSTPPNDSDRELQALGLAARGSVEVMVVQNSDLWGYLQPIGKSEKMCLPHIDFPKSSRKYQYTISVPQNKGQTAKHLLKFSRKSDNEPTRFTNLSDILTVKVNGGKISKGQVCNIEDGHIITIYYRYGVILYGSLSEHYDIGSFLGKGSFASVCCVVHRQTRKPYVAKIITRLPKRPSYEISCMKRLNHPNIRNLKEVFFHHNETTVLVMELCRHGDLFDYIAKTQGLSKEIAREVTFQICSGMAYVHSCGIVHRDLKPENILMASLDPLQIKISDFGLAKAPDLHGLLKSANGTELYIAPEIVTGHGSHSYDNRVDSWSVGVVVLVMLTGVVPFPSRNNMPVYHNRACDIWFTKRAMALAALRKKGYQPEEKAYQFCESLLQISPDLRKRLKDALELPWLIDLTEDMEIDEVHNMLVSFDTEEDM